MPEEEEQAEEGRLATWLVYVGSDPEPVHVHMDYDILGALWAKDSEAWTAVLEYVHGHIDSRNGGTASN